MSTGNNTYSYIKITIKICLSLQNYISNIKVIRNTRNARIYMKEVVQLEKIEIGADLNNWPVFGNLWVCERKTEKIFKTFSHE